MRACPPQAWPAELPPCPVKRIGRTDPLYPKAAHPARFQQKQHERNQLAVNNPQDPGGAASLASIAAQEQARQRLFTAVSQSCSDTLKHVLVTVNSAQADASRVLRGREKSGQDAQEAYESVPFNIVLPTPMTDLVAHRLIYGQIKSWEIDLLLRCRRDPARQHALINAPVNHEPLFAEDRYTLPITELYDIRPGRRTVMFNAQSGGCPTLDLPLTLVELERIVAFNGKTYPPLPDHLCANERPLYAFRTAEPHGYVPGMQFYLIAPPSRGTSKVHDSEPRNTDRFVVIDSGACDTSLDERMHMTNSRQIDGDCDCFEFVALRCRVDECAARQARVFRPFDDNAQGRFAVKLPRDVRFTLRSGCVFGEQCADSKTRHGVAVERARSPLVRKKPRFNARRTPAFSGTTQSDDDDDDDGNQSADDDHSIDDHDDDSDDSDPWFDWSDLESVHSETLSELMRSSTSDTGNWSHERSILACREFRRQTAFTYVPPPTSPQQLVALVNGTLDAVACCGQTTFDSMGIEVDYEPLIDQFVVRTARGQCSYQRSLFGDRCKSLTSLNFPLSRKSMIASECTLDDKRRYLERVLSHFFYFDVRAEHNDTFAVRLECGAQSNERVVRVPAACYPARFFVQALEQALNDAFAADPIEDADNDGQDDDNDDDVLCKQNDRTDSKPLFRVRYELFDTEQLVQARIEFQRSLAAGGSGVGSGGAAQSAALRSALATYATPYTNLTYAVFIEARDEQTLFSLRFDIDDNSRRFANLIDFDASQRYELQSIYTSRSLSLGCNDRRQQLRWLALAKSNCAIAGECAPCPRRKYESRVSEDCGLVTLEQRIQRPFRVVRIGAPERNGNQRVQIVPTDNADVPPVMFCQHDTVLLSATNPLCAPHGCSDDERLAVIVKECTVDTFVLSEAPQASDEFWVWSAPVGFNVHLHRNEPRDSCTNDYFDVEQSRALRLVSQSNPVVQFLGFLTPTTLSGAFCYTSDRTPSTIIDETVLVQVKELLPLAISEGRNTLYTPQSPFDNRMTQYYSQLLLDRGVGQYRAFPALTSPLPQLSAPADVLPAPGASNVTCPTVMTVELLRPDGSVFYPHDNPFVLTFEFVFVRQ